MSPRLPLAGELAAFAPNFGFELPPYFLNNARAIATLEGMARSAVRRAPRPNHNPRRARTTTRPASNQHARQRSARAFLFSAAPRVCAGPDF